jgi:hypothetical protein
MREWLKILHVIVATERTGAERESVWREWQASTVFAYACRAPIPFGIRCKRIMASGLSAAGVWCHGQNTGSPGLIRSPLNAHVPETAASLSRQS